MEGLITERLIEVNLTTNLKKIFDFENMYMKSFELKKGNISI